MKVKLIREKVKKKCECTWKIIKISEEEVNGIASNVEKKWDEKLKVRVKLNGIVNKNIAYENDR